MKFADRPKLQAHLKEVQRSLRLEPERERRVLRELSDHLEDLTDDLQRSGLSQEEADREAVRSLGSASVFGKELYQVYNQSSWNEALYALLPHLLIAVLFAFSLWQNLAWATLTMVTVSLVSFMSWRRGKPNWMYPWLSYTLLPAIISAIFSAAAIGIWLWLLLTDGTPPIGPPVYAGLILYVPLAMWLAVKTFLRILRCDWLYASLLALPLPFIALWFMATINQWSALSQDAALAHSMDKNTSLLFILLGVTTTAFLRLKRRGAKISTIVAATPILTAISLRYFIADPGLLVIVFFSLIALVILMSPAFMEHWVGHQDESLEELLPAQHEEGLTGPS